MTAARWRAAAIGGAAAALAFWGGTLVSRPSGPTVRPGGSTERAIVQRAIPVVAPGGLTRDDIRAVVREELALRAAGAEPASPSAASADPSSPEAQSAVAAARAAVADGIQRGVWGERERAALRAQLPRLDEDQTHEVLSPLFQAINAQELQLDGPPI